MTKLKLDLSPAEWEIMRVVWESGKPMTVRDVMALAYPAGEKAYTTVQTLMNILVGKGILKRRKVGQVNVYSSASSRETFFRRSISMVAKHLFAGSFGAMASYLVHTTQLSPEEMEKLRKLLAEKSGGTHD